MGCTVISASGLSDAMTSPYDAPQIIIADFHLDDGDGLEAITKIRRASSRHSRSTRDGRPQRRSEDAAQSLEVEILHKPVKPAPLRALLVRHLALKRPRTRGSVASAPVRLDCKAFMMSPRPFDDIRELSTTCLAPMRRPGPPRERGKPLDQPQDPWTARESGGVSGGWQGDGRMSMRRWWRSSRQSRGRAKGYRLSAVGDKSMVDNFTQGGAAINQFARPLT